MNKETATLQLIYSCNGLSNKISSEHVHPAIDYFLQSLYRNTIAEIQKIMLSKAPITEEDMKEAHLRLNDVFSQSLTEHQRYEAWMNTAANAQKTTDDLPF